MSHTTRFQSFQLPIVLATAFLDIMGIGILIPIFPFLIQDYHVSGEWVSYTLAVFSAGMFAGGFIFGKLSDIYGRRNMLLITTFLNVVGYLTVIFAPSFLFFVLGRFIAGLAGSGISVTQAYVSDISSPDRRARQMGLIGAMFGLGFLVGPAIGGVIANISHMAVAIAGTIAATLNLVIVYMFLPEPKKHVHEVELKNPEEASSFMKELFVLSFLTTIAFSPIQAISTQFYVDIFDFNASQLSYTMIVVGLTSLLYQGFCISFMRKKFHEIAMIFWGIGILTVAFFLISINTSMFWLWFILPFFPLGMGSMQPSIGSLVSHEAKKATGKYLGINNSLASLGNIIGPILGGYLYSKSIQLPFQVSTALFVLIGIFGMVFLRHRIQK